MKSPKEIVETMLTEQQSAEIFDKAYNGLIRATEKFQDQWESIKKNLSQYTSGELSGQLSGEAQRELKRAIRLLNDFFKNDLDPRGRGKLSQALDIIARADRL